MAGRGSTSFEKRRKEQQRKEKRELKLERKLERKKEASSGTSADPEVSSDALPVESQAIAIENSSTAEVTVP